MRQAKKVQGVLMEKVRIELVREASVRLGATVEGLSDAQLVGQLVSLYKQTVDKKGLADCTTCGGISDVAEPMCPYCGDTGIEETEPEPEPEVVPEVAEPEPSPEVAPPPSAIVPVILEHPLDEGDLDRAVSRVQELKLEAASSVWELGNEVKRLCDLELWKQRKDAEGVPKYKTWGQFTEAELGITHSYSFRLMDVSSNYTKEQVRQLGASKLYITLTVPKEQRDLLLHAAEEGASKRELEEMAEDIGKEPRTTGRTKKGGAGAHKGKGKAAPKRKAKTTDKVTVAMLCTRVEIPLCKGASKEKRAKSLIDMPVGEERLFNGVTQRFVLTKDDDGCLVLVVERTRE